MKNNKLSSKTNVLVTAALPYINNIPHLGHIVGSHLPADIFARYSRIKGYNTLFVGGTDEHGSTSEIAAERIGVPVEKFSSVLHDEHKKIYDWFEISYDNFSRTSSKIHRETTNEFFKSLDKNGFISQKSMKVMYSPKEDRFLPDRYVVGTCPHCGYEKATGDQCENCTALLDPTELINPKSAITGDPLEVRDSQHLFLRLDKLALPLKDWIKDQKHWRPQVQKLAMGWINEGLKERSITRDLKHGVKVPIKDFENKVFYVWFEAPISYISFTKEAKPNDWKKFWQSKQARVYNFLGKDNIPFHTIFWPAMVIANKQYNLPSNVIGLQYLNYEGGKFSKSQNRGVFCDRLPESGINPDVMRGALIPLIPETSDSEFKWEAFQQTINSDLIGNFGNFVNRTTSFINNNLGGIVSKPKKLSESDKHLADVLKEKTKKIGGLLESGETRSAFNEFLSLSAEGNKYFQESKPWEILKTDRKKTENILYICASLGKSLAIISSPFLPKSAQKIWNQLNLKGKVDKPGNWNLAEKLSFPNNHKINKPEILFEKMTDDSLKQFKEKVSLKRNISEFFVR